MRPLLVLSAALLLAAPLALAEDGGGETATDFTLPNLDGGNASLSEHLGEKVILVNFWATWCDPCMKSMPVYDSWQRELGERGFAVVAVSVDTADAPVAEYAARLAPSVQVLLDPEGVAPSTLALKGLPVAFLVGRDGIVRSSHVGFHTAEAEAVRAEIEALLAEAAPER